VIVRVLCGNTAATSIRACGSVRAGFFKLNPQPEQEVKRKEDIYHVAMPCRPGTVLILIHADLALSILKALLYRPTHCGCFA